MQTEQSVQKPVIFSGIQPTSDSPHLGNYVGAMRNWRRMQEDYRCIYSVVNLHALTVRGTPADLRRRTLNLYALLIAVGLDPQKSLLFVQSHVPQHSELTWLLNCYTYMGELSRMTQYKEKSQKHSENINAGLFDYPVLMAADILLYQANLVPVGADQKQHVELCRDIAERVNNVYTGVFTIPEPYIGKTGARVMSLADPTSKMSKSDGDETVIALLDTPDDIRRKLRRAVTDSEGEIRYDPKNKPGVSNLLGILGVLTDRTAQEAEASLAGQNYGALKEAVTEAVIAEFSPIRERYETLIADKAQLEQIMAEGAAQARAIAQRTVSKFSQKLGLLPPVQKGAADR